MGLWWTSEKDAEGVDHTKINWGGIGFSVIALFLFGPKMLSLAQSGVSKVGFLGGEKGAIASALGTAAETTAGWRATGLEKLGVTGGKTVTEPSAPAPAGAGAGASGPTR